MSVIKRIVGVGGDTIEIQGDVFIRNGDPIAYGEARASSQEASVCLEERATEMRWTIIEDLGTPPYDIAAIVVPAKSRLRRRRSPRPLERQPVLRHGHDRAAQGSGAGDCR